MNRDINSIYQYLLQQHAAEVYLENVNYDRETLEGRLAQGNNREPDTTGRAGQTRLTSAQIQEFLSSYSVVHQWSDNPQLADDRLFEGGPLANSGFSATLIRKNETNEYTLAIRSTEILATAQGGDQTRDVFGADAEIFSTGFPLAQWDAMERYYAWLKSDPSKLPPGAQLSVTGYSLGGNLATIFTEVHAEDVVETVTFNGAGRGGWNTSRGGLQDILTYYRSVLADPEVAAQPTATIDRAYRAAAIDARTHPEDGISIYEDVRHKWAVAATRLHFGLESYSSSDPERTQLINGARDKVTQIYGKEAPRDASYVANSGVHGPAVHQRGQARYLHNFSLRG